MFSEGLPLFKLIFFFLKIFKGFLKQPIFHVSNLNVRVLVPPTHSRQFDVNYGKIRYVSDP